MADEILLNEPKRVSAVNHESPEFLENDYNENDLYQVENIIPDETKEKNHWRKRGLEYESSNAIKNWNEMIYIHDNEVNNISEYNLLHYIINTPKTLKM